MVIQRNINNGLKNPVCEGTSINHTHTVMREREKWSGGRQRPDRERGRRRERRSGGGVIRGLWNLVSVLLASSTSFIVPLIPFSTRLLPFLLQFSLSPPSPPPPLPAFAPVSPGIVQ
jgi:hypothetical protein